MQLNELVDQVEGFNKLSPRETIRLFSWWLHVHGGRETIDNDALRKCYDELHMSAPNVAMYTGRMASQFEPPDLVKSKTGFKLTRELRQELDKKYGVHPSVIQVSNLLAELPSKLPDLAKKTFLVEALKCYRAEAYRACIVMVWNLAYNHLLNWILSDPARLAVFNATIVKRNSKKATLSVAKYDDFEDLKEREVVDICNIANLINSSVYKILAGKLDRRNIAAHPSNVVVVQSQADDTITDLVNNVVLGLA
jgi:hypothetical protein